MSLVKINWCVPAGVRGPQNWAGRQACRDKDQVFHMIRRIISGHFPQEYKQDRQCTCNVTFRRVRETIVVVEKQ
jgi:hypothetical protein